MTTTDTRAPLCRCGHERHPHKHLRRGTNCSRCDCPRWRTAGWRGHVLGAARGVGLLVAAVVLTSVLLVAFAWAVHGLVLVFRAIP
jgi:hypothetical protein